MPPTAGYVDDPVNAFNGNFVHQDEDVIIPGRASRIRVLRTYNSRAAHVAGLFGPGWSSAIDMAVDASDPSAPVMRLADGAQLPLTADQQGSFRSGLRAALALTPTPTGWALSESPTTAWLFDQRGRLVGGVGPDFIITLTRDSDAVTVREQRSSRWVRYELADGLVRQVVSSDGRSCGYRYDDGGRLVAVDRSAGPMTYEIDDQGLVSRIVDADDVVIVTNSYDSDGRVTSQTSPLGRTTDYTYGEGNVTIVADRQPHGVRNVLIHDHRGNVVAMFDGEGAVARMEYDALNRRRSLTDREGHTTTYAHDGWGQLTERIDPDGLSQRWQRDDLGRVIAEIDRAGTRTTYAYAGDSPIPSSIATPEGLTRVSTGLDGRPHRIVDADGVTSTFEWDADGLLIARTDGLGRRTKLVRDGTGQIIQEIDAAGRTITAQRDADGRVVGVDGPEGAQRYAWTAAGRLTAATQADDHEIRLVHGPAGDLIEVSDDLGNLTAVRRDRCANVIEQVLAGTDVHRFGHDAVGRRVEEVRPRGARTTYRYDRHGRPLEVTGPDGRTWRQTLDALGRVTTLTGPDGGRWQWTYHSSGELASVTDPDGGVCTVDVDALGRVVGVTDQSGATTGYVWTPAGRLSEVITATGRRVRYHHDDAGDLAAVEAGAGVTISLERDENRQVRRITDGLRSTMIERRADGLVVAVQDDRRRARIRRDSLGRPIEVTVGKTTSRLGWDGRGRLVHAIDPAGIESAFQLDAAGRVCATVTGPYRATYEYRPDGVIQAATDAAGGEVRYVHDAAGRLECVEQPDGTGIRLVHDAAGQVEEIRTLDGRPLSRVARGSSGIITQGETAAGHRSVLERDRVGRLIGHTQDGRRSTYRWDQDGLLTGLTDAGGRTTTIDRDEGGAITGYQLAGVQPIAPPDLESSRTRDDAGRIVVDEFGRTYDYDEAGRLARTVLPDGRKVAYEYDDRGLLAREIDAYGDICYRYDQAGRVIAITGSDGPDVALTYDEVGRRTSKRSADGSAVTYRWNELNQLVEFELIAPDRTHRLITMEYDVFGRPVVVDGRRVGYDDVVSNKPVWLDGRSILRHGNHIWADGKGWSAGRPDDPWGDDGHRDVRIGYRGELAVDHLVLMGVRPYDPQTRQFLSPDPLPPVPGRLCFTSTHAYAWNDPVNHVDPTGMRPLSDDDYAPLYETLLGELPAGGVPDPFAQWRSPPDANTHSASLYHEMAGLVDRTMLTPIEHGNGGRTTEDLEAIAALSPYTTAMGAVAYGLFERGRETMPLGGRLATRGIIAASAATSAADIAAGVQQRDAAQIVGGGTALATTLRGASIGGPKGVALAVIGFVVSELLKAAIRAIGDLPQTTGPPHGTPLHVHTACSFPQMGINCEFPR